MVIAEPARTALPDGKQIAAAAIQSGRWAVAVSGTACQTRVEAFQMTRNT